MKLIIATRNNGKVKEIRDILDGMGIEVISLAELKSEIEVVEDGKTFEENALKKAKEVMKEYNEITLADDSGLEVDYLNGAPGVYSARYAGEHATDEQRNQKLLEALKDVPYEERTARFVCAIAVAFPDGRDVIVRGECEGRINFKSEGRHGFGYDPLFYIPEHDMTMGQMSNELKNKISHRANALKLLKERLQIIFFGNQ